MLFYVLCGLSFTTIVTIWLSICYQRAWTAAMFGVSMSMLLAYIPYMFYTLFQNLGVTFQTVFEHLAADQEAIVMLLSKMGAT